LTASPRRFPARFAGAVALAMVAFAIGLWNDRIIEGNRLVDVVAFACGGSVLAQGMDPYRVHPLTECESAAHAFGLAWPPGALTLPAPLPPFALAPFALASRLAPFAVVAWSWVGLNLVAVAVAAGLLRRRLPALPPLTLGALLVVATLPVGILYGQFTGVVLLALVACGDLLARGAPRRAAAAGAIALLQPHVGLAPLVALFVLVPRTRLTIAGCLVALGAISLWPHPALAFEYLTVLGAHARANLPDFSQYSVPSILALAHAPATIALATGTVVYVAAIGAAVVAARAIAQRAGRPEAIPWIAAAIGTLAAPHLHLQQLACVLPGIALAFDAGGGGAFALVALGAFAIPWARFALSVAGAFASGGAALAIALPFSRRAAAYAATAAITLTFALMVVFVHSARITAEPALPAVAGNPLAEVPWSQTMLRMDGALHAAAIVVRTPTWLAMVACLVLIASVAIRGRPPRR